jgi:DNA-binding GntR family transcriptional regulator
MITSGNGGHHGKSVEQVYDQIRDAILDGELAAGSSMSQVALANQLGISRTPLREALRVLQGERLIQVDPGRRPRVAEVTPEDLEELCILRVTLEAQAVRLAIPKLTPEDLARLEGYIGEMSHFAAAEDYRRWTVPHRGFHLQLTAPAGERISDFVGQLFDHAARYRRLHIGAGPGAWATPDHRQILDACKSRDPDRGAILLARHLARTAFEVAELLRPGYENSNLRATLKDIGVS